VAMYYIIIRDSSSQEIFFQIFESKKAIITKNRPFFKLLYMPAKFWLRLIFFYIANPAER